MVHTFAVGGPAQLGLELGGREVERGERVARGGFGADHRSTRAAGQLDPGAQIGKPGIVFLAHFDIDATDLAVQLRDLCQLGLGLSPQPVTDLGVPALHDDVHTGSLPSVGTHPVPSTVVPALPVVQTRVGYPDYAAA